MITIAIKEMHYSAPSCSFAGSIPLILLTACWCQSPLWYIRSTLLSNHLARYIWICYKEDNGTEKVSPFHAIFVFLLNDQFILLGQAISQAFPLFYSSRVLQVLCLDQLLNWTNKQHFFRRIKQIRTCICHLGTEELQIVIKKKRRTNLSRFMTLFRLKNPEASSSCLPTNTYQ